MRARFCRPGRPAFLRSAPHQSVPAAAAPASGAGRRDRGDDGTEPPQPRDRSGGAGPAPAYLARPA
ncbi:hypothetical protein LP420_06730 [Massilia sp. B-10]|nr:hypothetical protein LP420_06730 [Massilia sp. B-10]